MFAHLLILDCPAFGSAVFAAQLGHHERLADRHGKPRKSDGILWRIWTRAGDIDRQNPLARQLGKMDNSCFRVALLACRALWKQANESFVLHDCKHSPKIALTEVLSVDDR